MWTPEGRKCSFFLVKQSREDWKRLELFPFGSVLDVDDG